MDQSHLAGGVDAQVAVVPGTIDRHLLADQRLRRRVRVHQPERLLACAVVTEDAPSLQIAEIEQPQSIGVGQPQAGAVARPDRVGAFAVGDHAMFLCAVDLPDPQPDPRTLIATERQPATVRRQADVAHPGLPHEHVTVDRRRAPGSLRRQPGRLQFGVDGLRESRAEWQQ